LFDHDLVMRAAIDRLRTLFKSGTGKLPAKDINFSGLEIDKLKAEVLNLNFEPYMPE